MVVLFTMFVLLVISFGPGSAQDQGVGVVIRGVDGFGLGGRYYAGGQGMPGVLLLHQCDRVGRPTGYENLAAMLSQRGLHVLSLSFRGYEGSRNEVYTGDNWQEAGRFFPDDSEAAYQFLAARPGVRTGSIAVVGASCGGRQAVLLAERHPEIKALVLLSGSLRSPIESALSTLIQRPVLAIAAEGDTTFARSMKTVFAHSRHPATRYVLYKGTDHGTPIFGRDKHLEPAIVDWIEERLNE